MRGLFAALVAVAALASTVDGYYIPGVEPKHFEKGAIVDLDVNNLESVKSSISYEYYSLPFCMSQVPDEIPENLGEILSGDRIETSDYQLRFGKEERCKVLCQRAYTNGEAHLLKKAVTQNYRVNWIVDNLPAATAFKTMETDENGKVKAGTDEKHYEKGFPIGYIGSDGAAYVNNHVRLIILYHKDAEVFKADAARIVGFEVEAFSVDHGDIADPGALAGGKGYVSTCPGANAMPGDSNASTSAATTAKINPQAVVVGHTKKITWTYSVKWVSSSTKWAKRWDLYLRTVDQENIHWFSIGNSLSIVAFLCCMIAVIMMRTLHRDFARYNLIAAADEEDGEEFGEEETGWKLIHGEVFRPPVNGAFFSVLIGSGVQVFVMVLLMLEMAVLGFLSPSNRGGLVSALLIFFVLSAPLAGYTSTRVYKMFKLTQWKRNAFHTAIFFTGVLATAIFMLKNVFVGMIPTTEEAALNSVQTPTRTVLALIVMWLGVAFPLVYLGAYFGYKKAAIEPPVKVNHIARMILPPTMFYTNKYFAIAIGGVLPFGAVFIELFFIISSVWQHQYYYVFGFLAMVFLILVVTCAEVAIVMCYFHLCSEDYHWWWRSFLTTGSSGVYIFLYSIQYFYTRLEMDDPYSAVTYFVYMALLSFAFSVLTGTIGYYSCDWFVRKIYSSIKID